MLAVPFAVVLALAAGFGHLSGHPAVAGALRGLGAVSAGLVAGTALKLAGRPARHARSAARPPWPSGRPPSGWWPWRGCRSPGCSSCSGRPPGWLASRRLAAAAPTRPLRRRPPQEPPP